MALLRSLEQEHVVFVSIATDHCSLNFFPYLLTYLFPYFPVDIVHVLGLSLRPRFGVAYIASLLKTVFEIFCF